jgi:leader peptidase (prepilin peptidase)/N-methyltransferase
MPLKDLEILLAFVFGAIIGSFLNVCIYRLPIKESIAYPGSYCPHCKKPIRWYDNIPILSYVLLLGRCGACKARIPLRYFAVEIATGLLLMSLYMVFGLRAKFFAYSALTCALMVAAFIDINTGEIPDEITLGGTAAGLAVACAFPAVFDAVSRMAALKYSVLGILAGGGSIFAMGAMGSLAFKKEAMGGGDVKMMAMVGAFIGWKLVLLAFFIAPIFGAVVGVFAKVRRGSETIPYGPYLSLGALIAVFCGNDLIKLLFSGL